MKKHILLICILTTSLTFAETNYIELYMQASAAHENNDPNAIDKMKLAFEAAIAAGNENYAECCAINGTEWLYNQNKVVASGEYAYSCHNAIEAMANQTLLPARQQIRRIILLGYYERGLQSAGKIGAAWKINRQVTELLRGEKITTTSDGAAITVSEIAKLPPQMEMYAWRVLEREADYLDLAGRTNEAKTLLDEAVTTIRTSWSGWSFKQRFYPKKILHTHANIIDFLGYQTEAIAAQEELERKIINISQYYDAHVILKMNILRNRSQWFGPSQELMDEAKATSSRAVSLSNKRNSQNMLAKMELDFSDSKDALQALAKDADDTANTGAAYEAFYSQREHLIARRKAGEKNLDANFQSMLLNARKQGNKRAEPTIYREYAQYLLDNKQVFESLQLFGEALSALVQN